MTLLLKNHDSSGVALSSNGSGNTQVKVCSSPAPIVAPMDGIIKYWSEQVRY